jgi:hypothetical protein
MDLTILAFFHILFINSLFIAIDYFILKTISKTSVSFLLIVMAGLISLFLGVYLTNHIVEYYFHDQWFGFSNGIVKKCVFVTGALILTVCTIIIELPFYILATKTKKFGPSLKSAVLSNLVTNIPIGLLYLVSKMFYSHPE